MLPDDGEANLALDVAVNITGKALGEIVEVTVLLDHGMTPSQ